MTDSHPPAPSLIERTLDHDRLIVAAGLVASTAMAWVWIVPMALDMYGSMAGPSAWAMTPDRDAGHLIRLFAMWAVMMVGMMLPSAAPTVLLYTTVVRRSRDGAAKAVRQAYAFVAGYLVVWTLFAVGATLLQRLLADGLILTPMMELRPRWPSAIVLFAAGLYQLTPFKATCLSSCRSPATFLAEAWRPGVAGAWHMGLRHGLVCLGCCWALMLLLFVGGVMNLASIALLTVVVLLEKLSPIGSATAIATGVLCLLASVGVVAGWL